MSNNENEGDNPLALRNPHDNIQFPVDFTDPELVGIQISADGTRLWICVNGQSVLRIKGCKHKIKCEKL